MSTLRINQRKHAVHKQAEKRPDPELHIIGEIVAASGFGPHGVSCRYEFVTVYVFTVSLRQGEIIRTLSVL